MVQRVTYRRRHSFRTTGNRVRKVKTPGGKLVVQYITKKSNIPSCGDCGEPLRGLPATRPHKLKLLKGRERKVARAYGGSRCGQCVRQRIIRAFLIEEQKIVKSVLRARKGTKTA